MTAALDDLKRVPLFAGMTDRALDAVAGLASEVAFGDGHPLTTEGDDDCTFYLLVEGTVGVTRDSLPVRTLGAGDFFGEISLIDGRPRTATVTATAPVRALVIDRDGFLELLERHGAVRLGIMMALADRIRSDEAGAIT